MELIGQRKVGGRVVGGVMMAAHYSLLKALAHKRGNFRNMEIVFYNVPPPAKTGHQQLLHWSGQRARDWSRMVGTCEGTLQ